MIFPQSWSTFRESILRNRMQAPLMHSNGRREERLGGYGRLLLCCCLLCDWEIWETWETVSVGRSCETCPRVVLWSDASASRLRRVLRQIFDTISLCLSHFVTSGFSVWDMESKKSSDVHVLGDIRSWLTVTLGLLNSLLFSGILFGWASLQAFLEDEGLYLDLCSDLSAILSCDQRKDRMLYLYSRGQMFSIFAYAFLSFLMDRTGPIFLSIVGGLLETLGLLLLAWADINSPEFGQMPFDIFDIAVVMTGVGASALMVHALTLAFLVPTSRFAMVMTLANCMVDGSAAMPALLYQLYRLGMSRQGIFTVYASLCFALNVAIIFSWIGPNMQKLRLKNEEESSQSSQSSQSSRQDENQSAPRLHGLPLTEQCRSFEFAFAFVMFVTQAMLPWNGMWWNVCNTQNA